MLVGFLFRQIHPHLFSISNDKVPHLYWHFAISPLIGDLSSAFDSIMQWVPSVVPPTLCTTSQASHYHGCR
jgi:hypothetical protein